MIFSVFPSVILLLASSILATPITSCLSESAVAPFAPSLPNRRNPHSFPTHNCGQNLRPPLPVAKRLESSPPEPSPNKNQDMFRSKSSQRNMIIALSTIGGTFVFCFLIAIIRCTCRYRSPPKRDRIAEAIERHDLQREMEELARNPHALRRPSVPEPAPPYVPRPPSYSESLSEGLHQDGTVRDDHPRNDSTYSPTSPTRNLLPNSLSTSGIPITNRQ